MQKPANLPAPSFAHGNIEPGGLGCLLTMAAAEEHRIEADKPKSFNILNPTVRTEVGAPPREPLVADGLSGVSGVADIVVAGNGEDTHTEGLHQLGRVLQVFLGVGAVHGDVPGVDDEVGVLCGDPGCERRPILCEMRLTGAQMRVRNLDYSHCTPHR